MLVNIKKRKIGFVLLYAVLLVSIVLTVSLSLFDITYRQLILSSTVENMQIAFYTMDSTRDCIRFWDNYWYYCGDYLEASCTFGNSNMTKNFFGQISDSFDHDANPLTADFTGMVAPPTPLPATLKCGEGVAVEYSDPTYITNCSDGVTCVSDNNFKFSYGDGTWAKVTVTKDIGTPRIDKFVVTGSNLPDTSTSLRRVEMTVSSK